MKIRPKDSAPQDAVSTPNTKNPPTQIIPVHRRLVFAMANLPYLDLLSHPHTRVFFLAVQKLVNHLIVGDLGWDCLHGLDDLRRYVHFARHFHSLRLLVALFVASHFRQEFSLFSLSAREGVHDRDIHDRTLCHPKG